MASDRWPMTRGELATRLSLALERVPVFGRRPGDLAAELVDAIDAQGTEDEDDRGGLPGVNPGNAADEALQRCRAALSWLSPDNRERAVGNLVGDVIKTGTPRILDPDLCARCGNQFPAGQLCGACHGAPLPMPPDAPEPLEDPDLLAMQMILNALADLDDDAIEAALTWACHRFRVAT